MKKTFITGITGQDGSYLAEFLLSKGYEVHGLIRHASTFNTSRIEHIYQDPHRQARRLFLHYGDIMNSEQIDNIIYNTKPAEIYNLGAQTHVRVSFDMPEYTGNVTGLATTRILESIRISRINSKFYQASSSEMFGQAQAPQNEKTPFHPRSPYAAAKVYSYWMVRNYREAYDYFASNGILFNHESPRRGKTFVTRKITVGAANILLKRQKYIYLGNIDARRDWGYAPEYTEVMWKILQQSKPGDYVIGSGREHSVREFISEVFSYVGLDWKEHIKIDKRYFRPTEIEKLRADISKARKELGWKPKITFRDLVKIMVDADMRRVGLTPIGEGDQILKKKFPKRWWKVD